MKIPVIAILSAIALVGAEPDHASTQPARAFEVGDPAPAFNATDTNGRKIFFVAEPGHVRVAYFCSATNSGSIAGLRRLRRYHSELPKNVSVFLIFPDTPEDLRAVTSQITEIPGAFSLVPDLQNRIAKQFRVRNRPCAVIVDDQGLVRDVRTSFGHISFSRFKLALRWACETKFVPPPDTPAADVSDPNADLPSLADLIANPTTQFQLKVLNASALQSVDAASESVRHHVPWNCAVADFDQHGRIDYCFSMPDGVLIVAGNGSAATKVRLGSTRDKAGIALVQPVPENRDSIWLTTVETWQATARKSAVALIRGDGRPLWSAIPLLDEKHYVEPKALAAADLDGDGRTEYLAALTLVRVEKDSDGRTTFSEEGTFLVILNSEGRLLCVAQPFRTNSYLTWFTAVPAIKSKRCGRIICIVGGRLWVFDFVPGNLRNPPATSPVPKG